jgi:hypothetical protein
MSDEDGVSIKIHPALARRIERMVQKQQDRYDSIETCRSQIIYAVIFLGLEGLEGADTVSEPTDTKH